MKNFPNAKDMKTLSDKYYLNNEKKELKNIKELIVMAAKQGRCRIYYNKKVASKILQILEDNGYNVAGDADSTTISWR